MALGGLVSSAALAAELPPALERALTQVEAGESRTAQIGVLSRHAHSDNAEIRLLSRTALARQERSAKNPRRALEWVEEYSQPIPDNYTWPRAAAFIEAARSSFDLGRAYDAVNRLNSANDRAEGLTKIAVRRALSELSQAQPDLKKALDLEKDALRYGNQFFKKVLISETAGHEPAKPGNDLWMEWKPLIEDRIKELERLIRIESYGLDYVLYEEAQQSRKAGHPLALDFTNVAAAFGMRNQKLDVQIPGADFQLAIDQYTMIIEDFPGNPYAQAAQLYRAVCRMHLGETDAAIKELQTFYKDDPTGLYRGEALKLLGDIYLFNRWDQANAREAYERSARWLEAMKTQTRVLETYVTPEKSQKISEPPRTIKMLTEEGFIREIKVPTNALVNRVTADWYLDVLRAEVEWRLGFIGILNDDWDKAFVHFDQALNTDSVVKSANDGGFFNEYHRLQVGRKGKAILATPDQLKGLSAREKAVIQWADFQFILADFEEALAIYQQIQTAAEKSKREVAYTRAVYGEMLAKLRLNRLSRESDLMRMHNLVLKYPNSPSAAGLLERCAYLTNGEPLTSGQYLEWIYTKYPKTDYAVNARYNEILQLPWEQATLRNNMSEKFKKDFPDWPGYHKALDLTDIDIRKAMKEHFPDQIIF